MAARGEPREAYQLRVVVYWTEQLYLSESMDVMVVTTLDLDSGTLKRQTDTHVGCQDGNAHFHYRHLFPLECLPHEARLLFRVTTPSGDSLGQSILELE